MGCGCDPIASLPRPLRGIAVFRRDGSRLSLEAVLSGAALALALELLLQKPAAAGPMPGSPSPGGAQAPEEREAFSNVAQGRPQEGEIPEAAQPSIMGGADAEAPSALEAEPRRAVAGGNGLADLPPPLQQRLPLLGLTTLLDSGDPVLTLPTGWPGLPVHPTGLGSPPADDTPVGSEGEAPQTTTTAVVSERHPSEPIPQTPPPRLLLHVEQRQSLVARSVEGSAVIDDHNQQSGLSASRLSLDASVEHLLQLDSLRRFSGLALSRLDEARLNQQGENRAIDASMILGSAGSGSYAIQASDSLTLALSGSIARHLQLVDRVIGLRDSTLSDPGGNNRIAIRASLELALAAAEPGLTMEASGSSGELRSTALQNSSLLLGDGADQVTISSLVRAALVPSAVAVPLPQAPSAGSGLGLLERAVALSGSLLASGGGNDRVRIEASGREAVALEDSQVLLGAGDDVLTLVGDVLRSRLAGGSGRNRIDVQGRVEEGAIGVDPNGVSTVQLSATNDSLTVEGAGRLDLDAGAGDDRLTISGSAWGRIEGGSGADWLAFTPLCRSADRQSLSLGGGEGRDLFVLAGLDPWLLDPATDPPTLPPPSASTRLEDLRLVRTGRGSLQLSDGLALQRVNITSPATSSETEPLELIPSGLEGLGDGKRLPIAPLASLLAGMGDGPPQLAIATGAAASELVLLRPGSTCLNLALLPALHAGDTSAPSTWRSA